MNVRPIVVAGLTIAALGARIPRSQAPPPRLGYSARAFATQDSLERRFRSGVSAERVSAFHRALTRRPHMAGSDGARVVADSIRSMLVGAGLAVEVLEYRAYLSTPAAISVALIAPVAETLRATEPASPLDRDTSNPELGPGFVAYSASGDVTAAVVYANYGLPADYAQLAAAGVDVRGKIVIARYGRSHRAVKLYTAEKAGVAGLIIYSDPADDGFARGDTWPRGYWRTRDQIQRGNGKYSWFWHGDALTPGAPALSDAARLDVATAPTLPRIPAAVLSWGEARKILERLDGAAAPPSFRGALPLTYRLGNGAVRVRLRVQMNAGLRTIRDVVARVPGARQGDRGVLLGAHHDAWTFGGVDPGTGAATLLEVARGLGALRRAGWRPERTITFAFWDAEEFGLIGSTEFAEQRQRQLREGTICYINTDLYTSGRLDAGGVPSLRDFLVEVAKDVPDTIGTMYDAWRADDWTRQTAERRSRGLDGFEVELKALGSGADFVPFQDFLGLPTLSLEMNATGGYSYGPYHSNYDTRWFAEHVADPGFRRGAQLARLLGTVALRLGEAPVLPFRFSHYAARLAEYAKTAATWPAASDGRATMALDFAPLNASIARMSARAATLEQRIDERVASGQLTGPTASRLNDVLARLEQRFLDESEPAERRWFRHVVYGWDIYSLYDGQPFPGLAEAVRLHDSTRATNELARITAAVDRVGAGLDEAHALARPARFLPIIAALLVMLLGAGWRVVYHRRRYGSTPLVVFRGATLREQVPEIAIVSLALVLLAEVVVWTAWPSALDSLVVMRPPEAWGVGAVVAGLGLLMRAQSDLGASWRVGIDRAARPGLVVNGLYRVSRNPIYLGAFVVLVGFVLLVPTALSVGILVGVLFVARFQVQAEERYLVEAYGSGYRSYARRVGRFVPWAGKLR